MDGYVFWLLVFLLVLVVVAWPGWPHTRGRGVYRRGGPWRWAPAGAAAATAVMLLALVWLGFLAIVLPWYPAAA